MPTFTYQAINESGTSVTGKVEAENLEAAQAKLAARNFIPIKLSEGASESAGGLLDALELALTSVKTQELILFTKQFKTMLVAGLSVMELFQVLEEQSENKKLKKLCGEMAEDIRQGRSLTTAFERHPSIFSGLYCSMVRAGEMSGALPEVMDRLIFIISHENKVRSDIRSALQYPITVVIALAIAFFVLLTYVIPNFAQIFKTAKLELPMPTVVAIKMNEFLVNYWYILIGGTVALVVGLHYYFKTEKGRLNRDAFFLKLPIFGKLFIKAAMSRFASIFAILQTSGVSALTSFDILSYTIGNAAISREFDQIKEMLKEGQGISGPLRRARYFTPMVINMVAVGEETGNLDEMLRAVSEHYDDEVSYSVSRLSEALGPLLMVGLAGVVGFFALAIFMPMWDLTKMVK